VKNYAEKGYMVRVRSDYDTLEARANDTSRARALSEAGAHFISTDFPSPPTHFNSSYEVCWRLELPCACGRSLRCSVPSPAAAATGCRAAAAWDALQDWDVYRFSCGAADHKCRRRRPLGWPAAAEWRLRRSLSSGLHAAAAAAAIFLIDFGKYGLDIIEKSAANRRCGCQQDSSATRS